MSRKETVAQHPAVEERSERGRAARKEVPRSAHALWEPRWVKTSDVDGVQRDYYVRQLWDAKGSALVEMMNPTALAYYAAVCGRTLARAHARAGDCVAIAAYLGRGDRFDRALAYFAEAYADQNESDYAAVVEAVESGRITAETEA